MRRSLWIEDRKDTDVIIGVPATSNLQDCRFVTHTDLKLVVILSEAQAKSKDLLSRRFWKTGHR